MNQMSFPTPHNNNVYASKQVAKVYPSNFWLSSEFLKSENDQKDGIIRLEENHKSYNFLNRKKQAE